MISTNFGLSLAVFTVAASVCCGSAHAESANHSPVVVSISANTGEIAGFNSIRVFRNLAPGHGEGMFAKQTFDLEPPSARWKLGRDTTIFIGALPPGEYSFRGFYAAGKSLTIGEKNLLGKFIVTAGKPVDLGRLVLTPVNSNVLIGRISLPSPNMALMRRVVPEKAALFAGEAASGWTGPNEAAQGFEKYSLSNTVGADCATERADGTVFAASRLGTVLMRSSAGRWRGIHGVGMESLFCVLPVGMPDTELVAVGEMLTLLRKPRGADQLVAINPGNLPPGDLMKINGSPSMGWFVVHKLGNNVTLYRSSKLEAGDWTVVLNEDIGKDNVLNSDGIFTWQTDVGMGYAKKKGPFMVFENASGQWSERALPPEHSYLKHVAANGNGVISMRCARVNSLHLLRDSNFISKDMGAHWTPIAQQPGNAWMQIQVLHDGTLITGSAGTHFSTSRDNGATWVPGGKHENRRFLPLRSGTLLNFDDGKYGYFSIDSSTDGGKEWFGEYSTFNRQAYEAQQKK